jgi:hypothetical protein
MPAPNPVNRASKSIAKKDKEFAAMLCRQWARVKLARSSTSGPASQHPLGVKLGVATMQVVHQARPGTIEFEDDESYFAKADVKIRNVKA